jgi:SelR domain
MGMDLPTTEEEWRAKLSPEQYEVLRCSATEPPFTGEYVHTKDAGVYRCAACGTELFSSEAKFDSGTGWPSFTEVPRGLTWTFPPMRATAWSGPRSSAADAAPTWATSSTTVRLPPGSGTASTRLLFI